MEKPLEETPDLNLNAGDGLFAQLLPVLQASGDEVREACCEALNVLRKLLATAATPNQTIAVKTLTSS
jgi:hypothetical protein